MAQGCAAIITLRDHPVQCVGDAIVLYITGSVGCSVWSTWLVFAAYFPWCRLAQQEARGVSGLAAQAAPGLFAIPRSVRLRDATKDWKHVLPHDDGVHQGAVAGLGMDDNKNNGIGAGPASSSAPRHHHHHLGRASTSSSTISSRHTTTQQQFQYEELFQLIKDAIPLPQSSPAMWRCSSP